MDSEKHCVDISCDRARQQDTCFSDLRVQQGSFTITTCATQLWETTKNAYKKKKKRNEGEKSVETTLYKLNGGSPLPPPPPFTLFSFISVYEMNKYMFIFFHICRAYLSASAYSRFVISANAPTERTRTLRLSALDCMKRRLDRSNFPLHEFLETRERLRNVTRTLLRQFVIYFES